MNKTLTLNVRERDLLLNTPLLKRLSGAAAERMLDSVSVVSIESRDIIFGQGSQAKNFYTILSGFVRIYTLSRDGRETDIGVYGPGDAIAIDAMFGDGTYHFNAQAAEAVLLATFNIAEMKRLSSESPEVAVALMSVLSSNLGQAMDCVADDRMHTAPQRLANFLLQNCPPTGGSIRFRLPFQKSLLAGKLGLAPEALSRAFSSLRSAGVAVHGRVIEINDVEALRNV